MEESIHKKMAIELFNYTWDLIEKESLTEDEKDAMLNAAHASRYHWGVVGAPLNFARGEWQISRVYSILGRPESAIFHGEKSLHLCKEHNLGEFDLGFAYEALARAASIQKEDEASSRWITLALNCADKVVNTENKNWLLKNIYSAKEGAIPK